MEHHLGEAGTSKNSIMALTNCPECKGQVSEQAKVCLHCGFQGPFSRPSPEPLGSGCWLVICLSVLLLAFLLAERYDQGSPVLFLVIVLGSLGLVGAVGLVLYRISKKESD